MPQVTLKRGEDITRAIRRFKRMVEREGIMKELKKRRYYMKPSEKRKEKREAAAKRRRKMKNRSKEQKN